MATYNSDSDLFLLCDRLDSWIRIRVLGSVLALGFGLSSQPRIHLLDSVLTLGFGLLDSFFCSLSLGSGLFRSVSAPESGLGFWVRFRLLSSVLTL